MKPLTCRLQRGNVNMNILNDEVNKINLFRHAEKLSSVLMDVLHRFKSIGFIHHNGIEKSSNLQPPLPCQASAKGILIMLSKFAYYYNSIILSYLALLWKSAIRKVICQNAVKKTIEYLTQIGYTY
jgi:hypothetical protein